MAKSVPTVGQAFLGDEPDVVRAIKVGVGVASASLDVDIVSTTAAQTVALLNVAAGVRVFDIQWQVLEAFTASDTITVGDGDSADGFLTSAMIGPTSSAAKPSRMIGDTSASRAGGYVYAAADAIDIVVTRDAAALIGQIEFVFFYTMSLDN